MTGGIQRSLRIQLLGGFAVAGAAPVDDATWRLRRARALVKLLALAPGHRLHREQVIDALWPEREPASPSNNLRQTIFAARRALDTAGDDGAARLQLDGDAVMLDAEGLRIDVDEFEELATEAERAGTIAACEAATRGYAELLPDDRFEDWTQARRQALRERNLALLVGLAALYEQAGEPDAAIATLQRALLEEPLHERAHQQLIRLYALGGRRQRALAQYHLLRESLRREFEDEPEPETRRLYQEVLTRRLGADDGPHEPAPAIRRRQEPAPGGGAGNLPLQLTSFIGRTRELADVVGSVRRARLVTLTGPGGAGKTRLALEAAARLLPEHEGGVWIVELAGVSDGGSVARAAAATLGVGDSWTRSIEEALAVRIGERELLLVVDNCEHVIDDAARLVEDLLVRCPRLRVLATSREPLRAGGEISWRVPSLTPADGASLFRDRASGVVSPFELPASEADDAVDEICRRVDGIPLAIELAAARVSALSPREIADRLAESLAVLASGRRTALTRQQTLTATLDWSYRLLDAGERTLLARLGVFAGSFRLEAAEDVCDGELDVLGRLVDKSLVVVEDDDGQARYRLLDTVRHYARERLAAGGEQPRRAERHRAHYVRLAEALEPTVDMPATRRRLASEADELRWALATALTDDPPAALRLTAALWRFWHERGERAEGVRRLEAALAAAPGTAPAAHRARAMRGLALLVSRGNDPEPSLQIAADTVELVRGSGDARALAEELHYMATLGWGLSAYDRAQDLCAESRAIAERAGEAAMVAAVVHTLGVIAASRGHLERGAALMQESFERLSALPEDGPPLLLPLAFGYARANGGRGPLPRLFVEKTFVTARRVAPAAATAHALCDRAAVAASRGDVAAATRLLDDALARFRRRGDDLGAAEALVQLGNIASGAGDHDAARELHEQSLELREKVGDARGTGLSLLAIALGAANAGEHSRAREHGERALALFERTDDRVGRACATVVLGYVAVDAGRGDDARTRLEQSFGLWSETGGNPGLMPAIASELAALARARRDADAARGWLERAAAISERIGDHVAAQRCRDALLPAQTRR